MRFRVLKLGVFGLSSICIFSRNLFPRNAISKERPWSLISFLSLASNYCPKNLSSASETKSYTLASRNYVRHVLGHRSRA